MVDNDSGTSLSRVDADKVNRLPPPWELVTGALKSPVFIPVRVPGAKKRPETTGAIDVGFRRYEFSSEVSP